MDVGSPSMLVRSGSAAHASHHPNSSGCVPPNPATSLTGIATPNQCERFSSACLAAVGLHARSQNFHESAVGGGGSAGVDLGIISFGGSVSASSHDASSTDAFARSLSQHADASSHHVESGVRAA